MIRVAINGFGRIGRTATRVFFDKHRDEMQLVGINDLIDARTLAHLLKYDSNYGVWARQVQGSNQPGLTPEVKSEPKNTPGVSSEDIEGKEMGQIKIDDFLIKVFSTKDPSKLPWKELGVDVVIESTGRFTSEEGMRGHITAGAKKVVLSAPSKDGKVGTFLLGVNEDKYKGEDLINNASCTTYSIAPVVAVIRSFSPYTSSKNSKILTSLH